LKLATPIVYNYSNKILELERLFNLLSELLEARFTWSGAEFELQEFVEQNKMVRLNPDNLDPKLLHLISLPISALYCSYQALYGDPDMQRFLGVNDGRTFDVRLKLTDEEIQQIEEHSEEIARDRILPIGDDSLSYIYVDKSPEGEVQYAAVAIN